MSHKILNFFPTFNAFEGALRKKKYESRLASLDTFSKSASRRGKAPPRSSARRKPRKERLNLLQRTCLTRPPFLNGMASSLLGRRREWALGWTFLRISVHSYLFYFVKIEATLECMMLL